MREAIKLNPNFNGLITPEILINHLETLVAKNVTISHSEILENLIAQFQPLDFVALAYPDAEKLRKHLAKLNPESDQAKEITKRLDKLKVNTKHFLISTIENTLKVAKENRWGLCKNHDFIYLFNGTFWSEIEKNTFQKFLGEAAEKMGVEKFTARYFQFREHLFKQFLATAYLPTPKNNKEMVLINLQNGTFEISQKETKLKAFDSSDFITYQLPFEFDKDAKAPLFVAYLNRVLPDIESQRVLAEYLGYVFIKHGSSLKLEAALILFGTGANGKSVFFEIVNALLGKENTSSFSLHELTDNTGYYRAMIANKLVNYSSEINGKLEADMFKRMVSGEIIPARLPYGNPMELTQYAKFIFNCNELPKDVEHTNAYFRRWLIIPFEVTIPENEQDKELHTKIIENELSGVFNWVLEGLKRLLLQKRFTDCSAAKRALEMYQTESNSVKLFLEENEYKCSPDNYKLIKELYLECRSFCSDDGMAPFKKTNFIKQLKALGIIIEKNRYGNVAFLIKEDDEY